MVGRAVKKDVSKPRFDFVDFAFQRLEPRLEEGLARHEYFRLCGVLFSLPKAQSKLLLRIFRRRFEVRERFAIGRAELFVPFIRGGCSA